jgi:GNAT superfamily N-acetyltransferase
MSDVTVGRSGIAGLGVFAARPFAIGETILILDDSRIVDSDHPLDEAAGELPAHRDFLANGRVVLMPSPERYINSSCDPNSYVVTREDGRHVVALAPIQQGDEVTYDYLINCHGGVVWQCHCGAAACRGTIPGSFFDQSPSEQWRLWPRLDRWFVREHPMPLRPPRPDDVPRLAALSEELGYPVSEGALADRLTRVIGRPDQIVVVACNDTGEAVGWIHGAEQLLLEVGPRCEILGLVVSKAERRHGTGRELLAAVEQWATARQLPEISVRSNVLREESHPFYEKMGYVRAKTQHAYRKPLAQKDR